MPSLYLNPSERGLLRELDASGARYLVVGGHAVQYHGYIRPAKDLDLLVDTSGDNPERVLAALQRVGISDPQLTPEKLSRLNQQIHVRWWVPLEVLTSIAGVTFQPAYEGRLTALEEGFPIPVLSKLHLCQSKRALAREQDLKDVEELYCREDGV